MREMKDSGVPWIGEIPKEWEVAPLWRTLRRRTEIGHPEEVVLSLYRDLGIVPKDSREDNHNVTSLDTSAYKFVRVGDFVINKMKAWQGSMAVSAYQGIVSPAYHVCEFISGRVNPRYLQYLLIHPSYLPEYGRLSSGLRIGQWDLSYDDFKNIPHIIPSLKEQQRIVDFLNNKCAEIESILEKTRASIEEYKKLKQSVITEAVTKGIRGDRKMKDSGVEWIGEIPEEWKLNRLKSVLSLLTDGTHQTPNYIEEGVPFLSIKDISSGKIDFSDVKFISEAEHVQLSKHANVEKGDVLFTRIGTLGVFVKVDTERVFDIFVSLGLMKIRQEMVNTDYLVYYLSSNCVLNYINQVKAGGGTSAAKFNLGDVAKTWIVLPKENEQQEIAAYLDEKCAAIDSLIASKEALITELESYKKSIIYEYVTGKKEVL